MAKVSHKISRKYAKALFELCAIEELDGMRSQLRVAAALWQESEMLRKVLTNPAYSVGDRIAAFCAVAEKAGVEDARLKNMLAILVENGRAGSLSCIVTVFSGMIDALRKALALSVTSAYPVSSEEVEALKAQLQRDYSGLASVTWHVDPALLGGLRIQAGDKLLDNSIKSSLDKVRAELLA